MALDRRRLVLAGAVALLVGGGVMVAVQASADPAPVDPVVATGPAEAGAAKVEGDWATTTTALPGLDPATGIGVSGPIGPPWPDRFTVADAIVPEVPIYQAPGVRVPTGRTL